MSGQTETQGSLTRCANDMYSPDAAVREEAARQIWLRFAGRLRGVVRRRLDPRILRRAGEDDVLNSLFASFFDAKPGPAGPPPSRADLWRLLVHFTVRKVANTADYHRAGRRHFGREVPMAGPADTEAAPGLLEPEDPRWMGPEDEAVAREEFARISLLPDDLRTVFDLRMEGYTNAEVAARLGRVERTVELKLKAIRAVLGPRLGALPPGPADVPTDGPRP